MFARTWWLSVVLVAGVGCVDGPKTSLVPTTPFGKPGMGPLGPELPPESKELAIRVASIGQKVAEANRQELSVHPCFFMAGSPKGEMEIFHRGSQEVIITEALARQCKSDGQIAAVLSQELARMTAEREALQRFVPRNAIDPPPPMDVPVGNDYSRLYGGSDGTRAFEMAKYQKELCQRHEQTYNPEVLARAYLQKAGYAPGLLAEVAPLLKAAESKATIENQLNPKTSTSKRN